MVTIGLVKSSSLKSTARSMALAAALRAQSAPPGIPVSRLLRCFNERSAMGSLTRSMLRAERFPDGIRWNGYAVIVIPVSIWMHVSTLSLPNGGKGGAPQVRKQFAEFFHRKHAVEQPGTVFPSDGQGLRRFPLRRNIAYDGFKDIIYGHHPLDVPVLVHEQRHK